MDPYSDFVVTIIDQLITTRRYDRFLDNEAQAWSDAVSAVTSNIDVDPWNIRSWNRCSFVDCKRKPQQKHVGYYTCSMIPSYSEHGGPEDNRRFERMTAHLLLLVRDSSEGTLQFAVETSDRVFFRRPEANRKRAGLVNLLPPVVLAFKAAANPPFTA